MMGFASLNPSGNGAPRGAPASSITCGQSLRAHARHDGLVRVATLLTFQASERPACRRPTRVPWIRTPDNSLLGLRILPCFWHRPCFRPVALRHRRLAAPLLAFIVVVEERALGADDPGATVAVGLETVLADQGTDARRLL